MFQNVWILHASPQNYILEIRASELSGLGTNILKVRQFCSSRQFCDLLIQVLEKGGLEGI
jgi:hypothetical protein